MQNPLPLRESGTMSEPWNYIFLLSMVFLSILIGVTTEISFSIVVTEILTLLLSMFFCRTPFKKHIIVTIMILFLIIYKAVYGIVVENYSLFYLYVCITQLSFWGTYYILRLIFHPDFNFMQKCKEKFIKFIVLVIGKETSEYLFEDKKS